MNAILRWWLILSLLGWLGWPLALGLFRHLPGRGYAFARALSLLAVGTLFWLLGVAGLLPNSAAALWGVTACLGALGIVGWVILRRQIAACLREEWRHILAVELLFALSLALYAAYKAYDPAINHTEEPMDFALLNGILRSPRMPPQDPWLSGYTISYYYLGYLLVAVMTRLTGVPSGVGYNLGLAQTLALTLSCASGALYGLAHLEDVPQGQRRRLIWIAAMGAALIALAGNLEGLFELLHALGVGSERFYAWLGVPGLAGAASGVGVVPEGRWWWWRASRVITDANYLGRTPTVITEFPAFSLILGDLHPHVMALPYAALAVALVGELYQRAQAGRQQSGRDLLFWPVAGWALGALGFLNSWDLPTYLGLAMLAYALGIWSGQSRPRTRLRQIVAGCVVLGALALAPYLPFYRTLNSQAQGIGLAYYAKTPLRHYLLALGLWLTPILAEVWGDLRGRITWRRFLLLWGLILVAPWLVTLLLGGPGRLLLGLGSLAISGPWLTLLQSASLAALLIEIAGRQGKGDPASGLIETPRQGVSRLLALVGLALTYVTEFAYIQDLFGTRMNTVFKLYYQAWMLLGIASTLATVSLWRKGGWRRAVALLSLLIALASLYYPVTAAYTRANGYQGQATLDGTAYLRVSSPGEQAAIEWLRQNATGQEVIIAAYGDEFDGSTSRLSAWTGVPTLLGWPGHEEQWRGDDREVLRRMRDLDALYASQDQGELLRLAKGYGATHLYVGPHERAKYGLDDARVAWYGSFLGACFAQEGVALFCLPID